MIKTNERTARTINELVRRYCGSVDLVWHQECSQKAHTADCVKLERKEKGEKMERL